MGEKYSVEDILAEMEKKDNRVEQNKQRSFSHDEADEIQLPDPTALTAELSRIEERRGRSSMDIEGESQRAQRPKRDLRVTQILEETLPVQRRESAAREKPKKSAPELHEILKELTKIDENIHNVNDDDNFPAHFLEDAKQPFPLEKQSSTEDFLVVAENEQDAIPSADASLTASAGLSVRRAGGEREKDKQPFTVDPEEIFGKSKIPPEKRKLKKSRKNPIFYEKAKVLPKPVLEDMTAEPIANSRDGVHEQKTDEIGDMFSGDTGNYTMQGFPIPENIIRTTDTESIDYDDPVLNSEIDLPEYANMPLRKQDKAVLRHYLDTQNPLALIDELNPLDIQQIANQKAEQSDAASSMELDTAVLMDFSGDTQGIAGNELKALADGAKSYPLPTDSDEGLTAEVGVKEYIPENKRRPETMPPEMLKAKRSNTALLESLNKAIKEKREKEILETQPVSGHLANTVNPFVAPATNALNIDYKKQIIKDTTLMPDSIDFNVSEQKMKELATKRKRKIRDFVLHDRMSSSDTDDAADEIEEITGEDDAADFDSYDATGQIWADLCASHKGLKIRVLILALLTGFLVFISMMNDWDVHMAYRVLGFWDVTFLDKGFDTFAYILLHFILGVIGIVSCATVVGGGLKKFVTLRGDCDSICALSAVIATASAIPYLFHPEAIKSGTGHLFVSVGLCALLFNTIGKLVMIVRAKRNFRFVSGDSVKYYAELVEDEQVSGAFTKGILSEIPVLCAMRKTEFLTDFLKSGYCNDYADQICRWLTPASFGVGVLVGVMAYFVPGAASPVHQNVLWALSAGLAAVTAFSPFSMMLLVNNPLLRASKALEKNHAVVLGYNAAVTFSAVNALLVDASVLFPPGSIAFRNIKRCQHPNTLNHIAIDEAIITAASLAIKGGSILTYMFYDMIAGKKELLYDVENCVYEVNMGLIGWIGTKRVMLGNREQMKHHGIKVPDRKKERKYCTENSEVVYLAVGGETVAMFFIEIVSNNKIRRTIQELCRNNVSISVRTLDSLVTVAKLADVFDIPPEKVKILPFDLHEKFEECTRYTSKGSGAVSCNGTFSSIASALIAAKKIVKDITFSSMSIFIQLFIGFILLSVFAIFGMTSYLTATNVILYNSFWLLVLLLLQKFRSYGD